MGSVVVNSVGGLHVDRVPCDECGGGGIVGEIVGELPTGPIDWDARVEPIKVVSDTRQKCPSCGGVGDKWPPKVELPDGSTYLRYRPWQMRQAMEAQEGDSE